MKIGKFLPFEQVNLNNGFWRDRYTLNKQVSVKSVYERFEDSGRLDALRFNYLKNGKRPHFYYDSDVAKWIEAIAYLLQKDRDSMIQYEIVCDELINCMEKAQRDDGYLNSFHQQIEPQNIFKIRNNHELYCAGHLIEAAIAYTKATGKEQFLRIMERYCDCIYNAFITQKTAAFITPGHEEIELALMKLYDYTANPKYLKMAKFFLANRSNQDEQYIYDGNKYVTQDDTNIYNLHEANGHSVRALYLYSGIADFAGEANDETLLSNLKDVFDDIINKKMYITGGVGSTYRTESFTVPYDLPNMTAYSESCCAVAMIMFATRMREMDASAKYGHVVERVLYNSMLSSTSLDGKSFFYENPLEIALEEYDREVAVPTNNRERLPIKQRLELFKCSCCPPNINRFFAELGSFICIEENEHVTVEQYINSDIDTSYGHLTIDGKYATEGKVRISSKDYHAKTLAIRIPEWCEMATVKLDGNLAESVQHDGYAYFDVGITFNLLLDFHIKPIFVSANPCVRADAGRVALTYGPLVYCLEGVDNGTRLNQIEVDISEINKVEISADFHKFYSISMPALRLKPQAALYYSARENEYEICTAKFIPYYAFANRGECDMLVWIRKH